MEEEDTGEFLIILFVKKLLTNKISHLIQTQGRKRMKDDNHRRRVAADNRMRTYKRTGW